MDKGGRGVNIDSYRLFLGAARLGSLTAAASEFGYTQSAVSHTIASLEKEFGFSLFARSKNGVVLTQDGERLLSHIREVVNRDDVVHQVANEIKGLRSGKVRIGAVSSVAVRWLPGLIAGFKKLYPNIGLDLRVEAYREIERWIANEEIDLGFTSMNPSGELEYLPLKEDRLLALLPDGFPLPKDAPFPLEKLAELDFIVPGEGTNYDIGRILRGAGIEPKVSFAVSDDLAAIAMVRSGLGITIVPELMLAGMSERPNAHELEPRCQRTVAIAAKHLSSLSPAARAFLDFTREQLGKNGIGIKKEQNDETV
ncbi:MAG: LysR family transcriptional regulator [Clostridia bacterium]|nr:LysR family transcriptional regulator [Clostridia bacterium]